MACEDEDLTVEERLASLEAKFAQEHPDEACPPITCDTPDQESSGSWLLAASVESSCAIALEPPSEDQGIAVVDGNTVEVHSGAADDPIQLEGLQVNQSGTAYGLISVKSDGTWEWFKPLETDDGRQYKLVTIGNKIQQVLDKCCTQLLSADVPEVCANDMQFILGGVQTTNEYGETVINLVKITRQDFYTSVCNECNIASYDEIWDIV